MATATSNVDAVLADLKAIVHGFDFERVVEDKTLGEDLAGIIADGIAARSIDEERGATVGWDANAPDYADWKEKKYNVRKPNVRTGQMLSIQSLLGMTTVSTHEVQMLYGLGEAPTRSSASDYFNPKTDGSITDIEKAYFCSATRPFYELDDTIANAVFDRIEQALTQYLARA
jgi:hypothetical protein